MTRVDDQVRGDVLAIDNGVWLEGLLRGGSAEELVKLGITGRVKLVTSRALIGELADTLRSRLDFSAAAIAQVDLFIRECALVLEDPEQLGTAVQAGPSLGTAANRAGSLVLSAADRAGATCIAVTAQSPLLALGSHAGIPIVAVV